MLSVKSPDQKHKAVIGKGIFEQALEIKKKTMSNIIKRIATLAVSARSIMIAAAFVAAFTIGSVNVFANHPVLVEGNCNNPPAGNPAPPAGSPAGTCGDFDGDGRIGTAEDTDGDRVFGTINGANSSAGINNNGTITIVTSGTFPETITLTGNVTLQAAPGVDANIDAVLQGDPGSGARQNAPGIIVNAPANRRVVIRNISSRNWTSGVQIFGDSNVLIVNSRFEHNTNYGIEVDGNARVTISGCEVTANGFRQSAVGDFPTTSTPNPGRGISFEEESTGTITNTIVSGNFAEGIFRVGGGKRVGQSNNTLFGNGGNDNSDN